MKYFEYIPSTSWNPEIKEIEIERETEDSIWVKGRRSAKFSSYRCYVSTYAEAKERMEKLVEDDLKREKQRHLNKITELLEYQEKLMIQL